MKPLNLPQPLLLVTIGLPGAGKSTFAGQLAAQHGFAWVHGNRLRSSLFASPGFSKDEEGMVDQLAEYMLVETLRTKGNVIFDSNAQTRLARMRLAKLARDAGYKVLVVWLQTDAETAQVRAAKRGRRPQDDSFATGLHPELFTRLAQQVAGPLGSEQYVVISGKHAFPTQARTLMTKIEELYQPKPVPKPEPKEQKPAKEAKKNPKLKPKPKVPSVEDIHRATPPSNPPERSRPRFDITRHIKFR